MAGFFLMLAVGALQAVPTAELRSSETRVRLEQSLSIRSREAAARPVVISLRDWVVRNGQTASLPAGGMLLMHLLGGGPVFTTVDGVRTERHDDEFFVVPADSALSVETGRETCVFTLLEVRR
jgi:hypothetical protein